MYKRDRRESFKQNPSVWKIHVQSRHNYKFNTERVARSCLLWQTCKKESHPMAIFPFGVAEGRWKQCVSQSNILFTESHKAWCNALLSNSTETTWQNWDWNYNIWRHVLHNVLAHHRGKKASRFLCMYTLNLKRVGPDSTGFLKMTVQPQ